METTPEKLTPAAVYEAVRLDAGKTTVANLAKKLNLREKDLKAMLFDHCMEAQVAPPKLKLKEDPKPPKPAKVFERGNNKSSLSLSAARLNYYGFMDVLRWESAQIAQNDVLVKGEDGFLTKAAIPQGAILIYPAAPVTTVGQKTEASEVVPAPSPIVTGNEEIVPGSYRDLYESGETGRLPATDLDAVPAIAGDYDGDPVDVAAFVEKPFAPIPEAEADPMSVNALTMALFRSGL